MTDTRRESGKESAKESRKEVRLDLATRDAGRDVRRRHARELAPLIVQQLHRLVRIGQLHALDNDAVRRQIDATAETLRDYHVRAAEGVSLFFAQGYVFFAGEPLRAGRSIYELAAELAQVLDRCGGSELAFSTEVTANDLRAFLNAVVSVLRDGRARYTSFEVPNVRVHPASSGTVLRGLGAEALDLEQQLVRAYSSAIVILRHFHDDLKKGEYVLPRRIKRIAQTLVDLSEGARPSFLGVTQVRNANHDLAGQAVNTAILAVAMARQITDDRPTLTRIAMAAMLQDVGLPHALGAQRLDTDEGDAPIAALSEERDLALPAETAGVMTALGRVNEPSIVRTVIAYEALWLRRTTRLGPVHRGLRPATLHARLLGTARAYNELLTPRPGEPAKTAGEALLQLEQEASGSAGPGQFADAADRTALRLLMAALGILPPGILVELSTGEIAVVVEQTTHAPPTLRVVVDGNAAIAERAIDFRLGSDARQIIRVVASDPSFVARRLADGPRPSRIQSASSASSASSLSSVSSASAPPSPVELAAVTAPTGEDATVVTSSPFEAALAEPPPEPVATKRRTLVPAGRVPDVEGSLTRTPLPNLIVHVLARNLTGSLVVQPERGGEYVLVFENAIPLKIGGDFGGARLGDLLVAAGVLDARLLARSLENARQTKRPIGRQLVSDGVLRADKLAIALERQMEDRLRALAAMARGGTYTFFKDHDLLVGDNATEPTPIDPLAAVLLSSRSWADPQRIDATLRTVEERTLGLHPASAIKRFRLTDHEKDALDAVIARGSSFKELCEDDHGVTLLRPVIYALAVTRHLDLGAADAWPLAVEKSQVQPDVAAAASRRSFPPVAPSRPVKLPTMPPPAPPEDKPSSRPPRAAAAPPPPVAPPVGPPPPAPASAPIPTSTPRFSAAPPPPARSSNLPSLVPSSGNAPPVVARPSTMPPRSGPRPSAVSASNPALRSSPLSTQSPPRTANPALEERRAKLNERLALVAGGDVFAILGVAKTATPQEVQAAYVAAAKVFHPDRLPPELAELRPAADKVFAAITEAHKIISDPEKRRLYESGGGQHRKEDEEKVQRALHAANNFAKAEHYLKRGDNKEAIKYAKLAAEGDPERGEHLALHGWLESMTESPQALQLGLSRIEASLKIDPDSDRSLYYRGAILKRMGKVDDAIKDFRRAATINPQNVDAVREIRLHGMRSEKSGASGGGLFSRWFGKK